MSVKLRFKRLGRKNRPFYRLVAIDSRKRRDGREIEKIGWFNPSSVDETFKFNEDRVVHWLDKGAIPSLTVKNLLGKVGFNHKYHLIKLGKSAEEIEKEMEAFLDREKNRDQRKAQKKADKKEKLKAKAKAEEAPAEEAAVEEAPAEEAAVEEAPAEEAAAEEAPAEEAAVEEAPAEEESEKKDEKGTDS